MTELDQASEVDDIDLAVVAYLDDGDWVLDDLPDSALEDLDSLTREVDGYPGPALAMLSVGEDFALLVRDGVRPRLLLSDATAATDWSLARAAADAIGVDLEEADLEDDEVVPAGDLALLADVGLSARELSALLADELDPEDLLSEIADQLGFGEDFDDLLEELDSDEPDDDE